MKKIISLALCLILVFSFTLSAFANTTEYDSISQNSAKVEIVGGKLHFSGQNGDGDYDCMDVSVLFY